jgi:purine-binding chemotaxis protein CheW
MEAITKIPNSENYIEGVINLRGKIIVVVDLAKKLNLIAKEQNKETRILVIEVNSSTVGMIVDSCNEVMRLSSEKIEPAPNIIKQKINVEYIEGVGILDNRLIILLDLIRVLGNQDLEVISSIQSQKTQGTKE